MKEKIFISFYEDDGQVDVEVYEWNDEEEEKGKLIPELSEYAFRSRFSANGYVETLKEQFEIKKEVSAMEEEKKYKEQLASVELKEFKPKFLTYVIKSCELEEQIQNYLSLKCQYPVVVDMDSNEYDSHYVNVKIPHDKNPEWVVRLLAEYYQKDVMEYIDLGKEVMSDLFPNFVESYWHPLHYDIVVSVANKKS